MSNFKAVSVSYKRAPLEVREQLSLNPTECQALQTKTKDIAGLSEILILSTCNRTEIYYAAPDDLSETLIKLLCIEKGIDNPANYLPYFEQLNGPEEAARHLFRVSVGLESQVVGDLQVTNQVKKAYQWSADAGLAGPFLHRLLHTIFFTNKRVVQETAFRDGAASVSYATAEMIQEITANMANPRILAVGMGEIGADVVRNLASSGMKEVIVANRTLAKAEELAQECGFAAVPFEQVWEQAAKATVVVSSIAMNQPFFTKAQISAMDILTFKCFVDLSVPRSIDPEVQDIPGVVVYNIDEINTRAEQALLKRKASVPAVEALVEKGMQDFLEWSKEMAFSPVIQKIKNALEHIRQEEISKAVRSLGEDEAKAVDRITKNIVNKIMRLPVMQLKAACKRGDAENLAEVLQELFDLEKQHQA